MNNKQTFVIIMGAGRCGTTSLVAYLNNKPNFNIYGENGGAIINILHAINNLECICHNYFSNNNIGTYIKYIDNIWNGAEWYNDLDKVNTLISNLKKEIVDFFPKNVNYIGFKEIRWTNNIEVLSILDNLFSIKYIYLSRDISDQIESMKRAKFALHDPEEFITTTNRIISQYLCDKTYRHYNISQNSNFLEEAYNFITNGDEAQVCI